MDPLLHPPDPPDPPFATHFPSLQQTLASPPLSKKQISRALGTASLPKVDCSPTTPFASPAQDPFTTEAVPVTTSDLILPASTGTTHDQFKGFTVHIPKNSIPLPSSSTSSSRNHQKTPPQTKRKEPLNYLPIPQQNTQSNDNSGTAEAAIKTLPTATEPPLADPVDLSFEKDLQEILSPSLPSSSHPAISPDPFLPSTSILPEPSDSVPFVTISSNPDRRTIPFTPKSSLKRPSPLSPPALTIFNPFTLLDAPHNKSIKLTETSDPSNLSKFPFSAFSPSPTKVPPPPNLPSGKNCRFWSDNWSPYGNLRQYFGLAPTTSLGIRASATLHDLFQQGRWLLPQPRSEAQLNLHIHLSTITLSEVNDEYTWSPLGSPLSTFSTGQVYNEIRPHQQKVPWHASIWSSRAYRDPPSQNSIDYSSSSHGKPPYTSSGLNATTVSIGSSFGQLRLSRGKPTCSSETASQASETKTPDSPPQCSSFGLIDDLLSV
ncbi:hypothetical protein HID58_032393 [Brassica napus]|uniref:Uncharacterized protein n=1 Tax=Brassica napus TaxID=3708 RepID=A0ABQ8BW84_BRANA|nr:hypothetical protein HID58_032393 [Brassica napus]